jgi:F-type H+-transporting ATPase subunit delta
MSGSATREALANLRTSREAVERGASPDTLISLSEELYSAADLLSSQPRLRRSLGDPGIPSAARAELAGTLLRSHLSGPALEIVQTAARLRWSTPWDLAEALERSADDALFAAAEQQGVLGEVEEQLFRFERIVDAESLLVTALDDGRQVPERRVALLNQLLQNKVHPITLSLLHHAVASRRRHSITFVIDDLLVEAAARQQRSLARVLSAVELTDEQQTRLSAVLTEMYGRPMTIRTAVDPSLRGGLVIRVGDELIDGSVASRLLGARAALAG